MVTALSRAIGSVARVSVLSAFVVVVLACLGGVPALQAQDLPPEAQRELDRRGMTAEEARTRARQLGIDLSNPQQAARRARELGIPESTVQAMLRAVEERGAASVVQPDTTYGQRGITLDDLPALAPPVLRKPLRQDSSVSVRAVLSSPSASIQDVDLALGWVPQGSAAGSRPDTLQAVGEERVAGSDQHGTWQGTFIVPPGVRPGVWTLTVRAVDATGQRSTIYTDAFLRVVEGDRDERDEPLEYFGYETFENVPESFQDVSAGPVGDSYVVGPQDELRLTVWGAAEFQYDLPVDREGRIYVPRVGQFTVAGKPLDQLRRDVRNWLSRSYSGLTSDPPTVFMDLTVTRLRPLQLFVLGEVPQPGGYTLPSGSNVFNALYRVGGPLRSGSLRDVRIIRNEQATTVDVYDYLLSGYVENPVQLQSNDHVFIPPRGRTVAIEGAVHRPAIYELQEDETFEDLLQFAGGLEAEAYTKRFQIERIVPFAEREDPAVARTVLDYDMARVLGTEMQVELEDGDRVTIYSIADRNDLAALSRVRTATIAGAVYKPGRYELGSQLRTVRDLIETADGLTGNAFRDKAELVRLTDSLEWSIVPLDLEAVLRDEPTQNLVLRPQDSLRVYSRRELEAERTVQISGQVRQPGEYDLLQGMTVADLLFKGGGLNDPVYLRDVFMARADLVRHSLDGQETQIVPFDLAATLHGEGMANTLLRPGDEVHVYGSGVVQPVDREARFVMISGAVKSPGRYQYHDNMSMEDLILRAGGFREDTFLQEAEVTRQKETDADDGLRARRIEVPLLAGPTVAPPSSEIPADTLGAMAAAAGFHLEHRDHVYIRSNPAFHEQMTVTVRGEVEFPGEYTLLHENETLSEVIRRAGGVLPTGYVGGGRLRRNGEPVVVSMKRALGGSREDVILQNGDEIIIPPQPNTVAVRGNVGLEGLIKYVPGKRVSYYLERAGGTLDETENIFLTQASGATFSVKDGLFSRYPVVEDGAAILVTREPPKQPGERINVTQLITDTVSVVSSLVTIIVLSRRAFN